MNILFLILPNNLIIGLTLFNAAIAPSLFIFFIAVYILFKLFYLLKNPSKRKFYELVKEFFFNDDTDNNETVDETYIRHKINQKGYYIYYGRDLGLSDIEIEDILNKYYTYYKNLNATLKHRFFNRLYKFMDSKIFIIHSIEPFKEMPVLISAAAVQISFGLDQYELSHYSYIQIHREEYFAENSLRVLAGNVQGNCITLAWNQLLKGYENSFDGNNVGLHEMAHALYFQEVIIDKEKDLFDYHFSELVKKGENIISNEKCPFNLYTDYAFTSLQEFWAVSVELFFERAQDLNNFYPNIFEILKNILQQNPIVINQPLLSLETQH